MRRSSSTMSRCGASSASGADSVIMACIGLASTSCRSTILAENRALGTWSARAAGARNEPQHPIPVVDVDHGDQEPASRLMGVRPELGQSARNAAGLQAGELHGQRLALGGDEQQPLAPVVGALL